MELSEDGVLKLLFETDPYEFEYLVATLFEKWGEGWETIVTSGSNDRGIDIIVEKSAPFGQKYAIQVKQNSPENKVGSPKIQQYNSIRDQDNEIDGVVIITTSSFTAQAQDAASDLGLKLIDGDELTELFMSSYGSAAFNKFFDMPPEENLDQKASGVSQNTSDTLNHPEPNESLVLQAWDAICNRYGRGLKGPIELENKSCAECGSTIYQGKIIYPRSPKEIMFCTDCKTVFLNQKEGWKSKPIPI